MGILKVRTLSARAAGIIGGVGLAAIATRALANRMDEAIAVPLQPEGQSLRELPRLAIPLTDPGDDIESVRQEVDLKEEAKARKDFLKNLVSHAIFAVALLLTVVLENDFMRTFFGHLHVSELDSGINQTDGTVIVAGLLTVVAALCIALAASPPVLQGESARRNARASVWAEKIALSCMLAGSLAFAVSLTQVLPFFGSGQAKSGFGLVLALVAMGSISIFLSASVLTWTGREVYALVRYEHKRNLERPKVDAFLATVRCISPAQVKASYVRFVVVASIITAGTQIGLMTFSSLMLGFHPNWWGLVGVFIVFIVLSLAFTWSFLYVTVQRWLTDLASNSSDRWGMVILRSGLLLLFFTVYGQLWVGFNKGGISLALASTFHASGVEDRSGCWSPARVNSVIGV